MYPLAYEAIQKLKRRERWIIILHLIFFTSSSHATLSCHDFLKSVLNNANQVESIQNAFQKELQLQKESIKTDLMLAAKEAQRECQDADCLEEKFIKEINLKETIGKACPIDINQNSSQIIQQIRNLAIGLSALGFSYTSSINKALETDSELPDFPFDITASVITLSLWRTWVMCKNEYSVGEHELPWAKRAWKNFLAYQNVILFGNFVYIGFVAGEDWVRGEDIISEEKLKAYGTEFVVSYVWDQAFAGLGVVAIDPLMKRLPELAPGISTLIGKKILSPAMNAKLVELNQRNFLFIKIGNPLDLIGITIDYGTRSSYSTGRSMIWLEVRKLIDQFSSQTSPNQDH